MVTKADAVKRINDGGLDYLACLALVVNGQVPIELRQETYNGLLQWYAYAKGTTFVLECHPSKGDLIDLLSTAGIRQEQIR